MPFPNIGEPFESRRDARGHASCAPAGRVLAIEPDWPVMVIRGEDVDIADAVAAEIAEEVHDPRPGDPYRPG